MRPASSNRTRKGGVTTHLGPGDDGAGVRAGECADAAGLGPTRREWLTALVGVAGAGALLGCDAEGAQGVPEDRLTSTTEQLIGTSGIVWVDTNADLKAVTSQGVGVDRT